MKKIVKLPLLLLSLVCILAALQCKKNKNPNSDNGLPPATQDGRNIFACRVNGEPWISDKQFPYPYGGYENGILGVNGTRHSNPADINDGVFNISLRTSMTQGNSYQLNDTSRQFAVYLSSNSSCFDNTGSYGTHAVYAVNGNLHLTKLDTVQKIVSGTFWFNIPTQYCDTIRVTDGRFDFHY